MQFWHKKYMTTDKITPQKNAILSVKKYQK